MFQFLLVVQAIIAAALVGVILMQRSEGGGLGMGGSPTGLMSARGAADFLTRATTILATMFVLMSVTLATIASLNYRSGEIDTSLAKQAAAPQPQDTPAPADPLAAAAAQATDTTPAAPPSAAPSPTAPASARPKVRAAPEVIQTMPADPPPMTRTLPAPTPAPSASPSPSAR